ncbi:TldD/PmbA family protein [Myxococcota bacterium]|nr:TldD/PmbA family protein [Myxococcota bacterium]
MTNTNARVERLLGLGHDVVGRAKARGAEVAEVLARDHLQLSAKVRLGEPELIEEAGSFAIGLRVIVKNRSALTYTSDPSSAGLDALVDDALELASLSQPDEHAVPPDPALLERNPPNLDLFDPAVEALDAKEATARAIRAEKAALAADRRITNSEGATFAKTSSASAMVTSGGFAAGYRSSNVSLDVNPIADDADGKKRTGYHWDSRRHLSQLMADEAVGRRATERTVEKLGARKVETQEVPVIFDPEAGRGLLSLFFSCISGTAIYQRASYLLEREGDLVASDLVTIVDDPLVVRGPGSRPFDGEGLASRKNVVVEGGKLKTFLLDTYAARKLGRQSTGSAARSVGGRPGVAPTNFMMLPGKAKPEDLVRGVERGLYVTSTMGFGFNAVTGDFSRGAEGFWIENGEKKFPVGEITISLGFDDLWKNIDAIADDLDLKSSYAVPTFRVKKMTLAGT